MKFTAVAFDLDGTLYPAFRLYVRLIPFFFRENRLLMAMGKARKQLRGSYNNSGPAAGAAEGDFYDAQARIMADVLHRRGSPKETWEEVREHSERHIYRGWEQHFKKIRLFPHVKETLDAFRNAGIKLGLLSDFPPETKLEYLGISEYWSAVVCSERCGRLKPDPASFLELARRMGLPPEQLLYVGNNVSYDVGGAAGVGMKTALIRSRWKSFVKAAFNKTPVPDFIFSDYRQLSQYVIG